MLSKTFLVRELNTKTRIRDLTKADRTTATHEKEIKEEFHIFYKNLYKEEIRSDKIDKNKSRHFCTNRKDDQKKRSQMKM